MNKLEQAQHAYRIAPKGLKLYRLRKLQKAMNEQLASEVAIKQDVTGGFV